MRPRPTISAILITKNEERNIAECLESITFCDEIVIVDCGSTDQTVQCARDLGAVVHVIEDWQGFGIQKQRALDLATCDWVLSIDADERVPPGLRSEIETAVITDGYLGYFLNRITWFLGQRMRHGGLHPDRMIRLARRDKAKFTPTIVHESLVVEGEVGSLEDPLLHYSFRNIDDAIRKMHQYVLLTAETRRRDKKAGGLFIAITRSWYAFIKAYVLQAGFLDGRRGYVSAVLAAQNVFWRYLAAGWEEG
jgi:glycosyltransferase involved in cell wall biosynthesis